VAFWPPCDSILHASFDLSTKKSQVSCVNAAIHKPIAVCGRHHAMLCDTQEIALLNRDFGKLLEGLGPRINQVSIAVNEM
jgi:hypothetical protein